MKQFGAAGQASRGPFRFDFSLSPDGLKVRGFDNQDVMDLPLEWAFGAGDQAVTFVTRIDDQWYIEHALSYYAALGGMALTPGQDAIQPKSLPEAMGLAYKTLDPAAGIKGCFECHSTGPVSVRAGNELRPAEPGVRCESCHGPGGGHARTADVQLILNPRRLTASKLNDFCGRCHRPPAAQGQSIDWDYAWNVRHQPVYLSQSECFKRSGGALSCLTCHTAHEKLERSASFYNQRCAGCHSSELRPPAAVCAPACIDCHMPRVAPQPPLRFTNHWIGVYGEGAKLKPAQNRKRSAN